MVQRDHVIAQVWQIVMIQADSLPFGGQWHGREGFERWMQAFGEAWSSVSATGLRFFEHDDTVVVVAQMEATARASGQSFRAPICHVVRIRDGLLMEFQMFYWDTVATNRALARDQHFVKVIAARLRRPAPRWDRRTTRMSETSEYSYELCGHDPNRRLVLVAAEGPTGDPTLHSNLQLGNHFRAPRCDVGRAGRDRR